LRSDYILVNDDRCTAISFEEDPCVRRLFIFAAPGLGATGIQALPVSSLPAMERVAQYSIPTCVINIWLARMDLEKDVSLLPRHEMCYELMRVSSLCNVPRAKVSQGSWGLLGFHIMRLDTPTFHAPAYSAKQSCPHCVWKQEQRQAGDPSV
jgi:hypothetical protein